MKKLLWLSLLFFCTVSAAGQFNTSSWDISYIVGDDRRANEFIIAIADPLSNDTAIRVYYKMDGFIGILAEEHVMDSKGQCWIGYRAAQNGRSAMRYDRRACHQYDVYYAKWREAAQHMIRNPKTAPLEKQQEN